MLWPSGGHLKEDGKGAAQKQLGGEWWRLSGTAQAGARGTQHAVQLQTETSGRMMSEPCVPPGTERIKAKVRVKF